MVGALALRKREQCLHDSAHVADEGVRAGELGEVATTRRNRDRVDAQRLGGRDVLVRVADLSSSVGGPVVGAVTRQLEQDDPILGLAPEGALTGREKRARPSRSSRARAIGSGFPVTSERRTPAASSRASPPAAPGRASQSRVSDAVSSSR